MQLLHTVAIFLITGILFSPLVVVGEESTEVVEVVKTSEVGEPRLERELRLVLDSLPAVHGAKEVEFESIDNKPVIVTFFASWCPPCLDEFSNLNQLIGEYADTDLRVVAINVYEAWDDNDAERMTRFIEKTQPVFPTLVGSEQVREKFGGIDRIPTVYGFDRAGSLVYRFIHKRGSATTHASYNELNKAALNLLKTD